MQVRFEDCPDDIEFELPECDFCDDRGCGECHPDDFAEMALKWTCDGTSSIDDAVEALQEFVKDLRDYQDNGFELTEPVDGGRFWLEKVNQGKSSSSPSDDTVPGDST